MDRWNPALDRLESLPADRYSDPAVRPRRHRRHDPEPDRTIRAGGARGYSTISLSDIPSNVANKALLEACQLIPPHRTTLI